MRFLEHIKGPPSQGTSTSHQVPETSTIENHAVEKSAIAKGAEAVKDAAKKIEDGVKEKLDPRSTHIQPDGARKAVEFEHAKADDANRSGMIAPTASHKAEGRPGIERRTTVQTSDMLLSLDSIPKTHNILASFFTWLLLAGYVVFPATFTSVRESEKLIETEDHASEIEAKILGTVKNAPLLYIAAFCCGIGTLGCGWLWQHHRRNYIWLVNRIFLTSFMNALAGLISTLVNVYSAQGGEFSVTAKVTVIVTSACAVVTAGLLLAYNTWALGRVKKRHQKDINASLESGIVGEMGGEMRTKEKGRKT